MEVPTILYFLKQRIAEQIVDNPVPHGGRGASGGLQGFLPGHVEQTVDIPVPGGGGGPSSGLQGFSSGQRATASPSRKRISERIVEQIVDPVSRGGLHGSSSSHSPAGDEERADEPGKVFFSHFSPN